MKTFKLSSLLKSQKILVLEEAEKLLSKANCAKLDEILTVQHPGIKEEDIKKVVSNAISEIKECNIFDIESDSAFNVIKNVLSNKFPRGENITKPDILIGAGHKTHISMLSAKYTKKGKIVRSKCYVATFC